MYKDTAKKIRASIHDVHSDLVSYKQDSQWVPKFYTRPGPGMYENNRNMSNLSKHPRSSSASITESGMLRGMFKKAGPKHRFTDFSKA
jgi:hypothetical protein